MPSEITPHLAPWVWQVVASRGSQLLLTTLHANPASQSLHCRALPHWSGTDPQAPNPQLTGWQGPQVSVRPSQTRPDGQVPQLTALPQASGTMPHSAPSAAQIESEGTHW
jgi:hypothetical protein